MRLIAIKGFNRLTALVSGLLVFLMLKMFKIKKETPFFPELVALCMFKKGQNVLNLSNKHSLDSIISSSIHVNVSAGFIQKMSMQMQLLIKSKWITCKDGTFNSNSNPFVSTCVHSIIPKIQCCPEETEWETCLFYMNCNMCLTHLLAHKISSKTILQYLLGTYGFQ